MAAGDERDRVSSLNSCCVEIVREAFHVAVRRTLHARLVDDRSAEAAVQGGTERPRSNVPRRARELLSDVPGHQSLGVGEVMIESHQCEVLALRAGGRAAQTFVARQEKVAGSDDRAAEHSAELIRPVRWIDFPGAVDRSRGVEGAITKEFEGGAMHRVRA